MKNTKVELSTIFGKESNFEGTFKVKGGIRIDGSLIGSLESDGFVIIGKTGSAKADISAKDCLISGSVVGNVKVTGTLELDKTANIQGDVMANILHVHPGAKLQGQCSMKADGASK